MKKLEVRAKALTALHMHVFELGGKIVISPELINAIKTNPQVTPSKDSNRNDMRFDITTPFMIDDLNRIHEWVDMYSTAEPTMLSLELRKMLSGVNRWSFRGWYDRNHSAIHTSYQTFGNVTVRVRVSIDRLYKTNTISIAFRTNDYIVSFEVGPNAVINVCYAETANENYVFTDHDKVY